MGYLKERIKHAVRFRHKRGYGVHSPFMFNLILNVIRDREKQFQYPEKLERENCLNHRERKIFRLLSRLVRSLRVHRMICLGKNADILCRYLQEVCDVEISVNQLDTLQSADFIYIGRQFPLDETTFAGMLQNHPQKCIVIADIHKKGIHARLWHQWLEKATVSVDMMWYGILFFDDKIQEGRYWLMI